MNKFTYADYIKYQNFIFQDIWKVNEESEAYQINNEKSRKVDKPKDKTYKLLFEYKQETAGFINEILGLKGTINEIDAKDIEKYNREFETEQLKKLEADIVYKKKGEDIFFLIEHQSKVDYSMPYRLLNYSIEIIRSAVAVEKLTKKDYKFPVVYPIVLYIGKQKWNVKKFFEECQLKQPGVGNCPFTFYNIVDVNNYTEKELLEKVNLLPKVLLLEKARTNETLKENLEKILQQDLPKEQKRILKKVLIYVVSKKIGEEETKRFVDKLEEEEGEDKMSALADFIWETFDEKMEMGLKEGLEKGLQRGLQRGLEKGLKKGKERIIAKMIQNKMDEKMICDIAEIDLKELHKIKNKIKKCKV
ncbi:MAG: Rpn family recombination-promoting nuclease/putative transposase [Clostridia bacterium]|nr:Rpn family recombination-promoting nuclease/putative transposase [Clostridia bacterium]